MEGRLPDSIGDLDTFTQADNRRSELMVAVQRGEAFDEATGAPVRRNDVPWYQHAREYIDMKWTDSPASTRRGHGHRHPRARHSAGDEGLHPSFRVHA